MTKALVIFAHPCAESFSAALHQQVLTTLTTKGWDIDDCDLNAEGFDPVLRAEERRNYHDVAVNTASVQSYVDRLRSADALIMVFPVWNFGYPAIMKGFLDRVFLPGVSFQLDEGKVRPNLTHIDKLVAVTTYGGSRMRAILAGDPPKRSFTRAVRHVTQPSVMKYLALYDMNRASDEKRRGFLNRVGRELESL